MTHPNIRQTARSAAVQARYDHDREVARKKYGDNLPCPLCNRRERTVLKGTSTMYVARNDYPYETFDGQRIERHFMVVPKRHVGLMTDFNEQEREEYYNLISLYHRRGYSSLTRSAVDTHRSVPEHLHTHLFFYTATE